MRRPPLLHQWWSYTSGGDVAGDLDDGVDHGLEGFFVARDQRGNETVEAVEDRPIPWLLRRKSVVDQVDVAHPACTKMALSKCRMDSKYLERR